MKIVEVPPARVPKSEPFPTITSFLDPELRVVEMETLARSNPECWDGPVLGVFNGNVVQSTYFELRAAQRLGLPVHTLGINVMLKCPQGWVFTRRLPGGISDPRALAVSANETAEPGDERNDWWVGCVRAVREEVGAAFPLRLQSGPHFFAVARPERPATWGVGFVAETGTSWKRITAAHAVAVGRDEVNIYVARDVTRVSPIIDYCLRFASR